MARAVPVVSAGIAGLVGLTRVPAELARGYRLGGTPAHFLAGRL